MAINIPGAVHAELNIVDKDKKAQTILPYNTADDVLVDENCNTLSEALPTITENGTEVSGFLDASELKEETITSAALINKLTSETVEEEDEQDSEPGE